jgi:3-phosphoshikimate 1-carboxyvinyltransferase
VTINNPLSTQFVSAMLLIGANAQTNSTSPYITLTRELIQRYTTLHNSTQRYTIEKDWSSAAFWYEYVALHGGEITLPGLSSDSLQGDKVVADIFAHLGVHTIYTDEGITIKKDNEFLIQQHKQLIPTTLRGNQLPAAPGAKANNPCRSRELIRAEVVDIVVDNTLSLDFANCPDLYPAVAITCERLGVKLHATGVESLPLKESDRLRAVAEHRTDADHRMAMALLIADYDVDDTDCISKSYPQFMEHFRQLPRM